MLSAGFKVKLQIEWVRDAALRKRRLYVERTQARRRGARRLNNGTSWKRVVMAKRRPRWAVDSAKGEEKKEKWHEGVIYLLVYLFSLFLLSLPFFRSQTDDEIAAGAPGRPGNWYQGSEIRLYLCSDSFIYGWIYV